jgi:aspartate kinase
LLYEILRDLRLKPNLTQNAAISIMICIDDIEEKTAELASRASTIFDVQIQKNLTLLTIRHYTPEYIELFSKNNEILLEQKTQETIQILIKQEETK